MSKNDDFFTLPTNIALGLGLLWIFFMPGTGIIGFVVILIVAVLIYQQGKKIEISKVNSGLWRVAPKFHIFGKEKV